MKPQFKESGITDDVRFGEQTTVVLPVNLYGCSIGDHSFVGPYTEIQRDSHIGKHCRIQSHSFICEGVVIGDHCFIGHGVMFVNDLFSGGGPSGPTGWKKSTVGSHVSIGSNATILPVNICDHVVIGAGAVVTRDIIAPGIYAGNPACLIRTLPDDPLPGRTHPGNQPKQ